MPGKGIQFEPVLNYQTAPRYAYFQPNRYPEKTPEKCIYCETASNYHNTPGQVHEGDRSLGQQNPDFAYYLHNVHQEKMPGKGTDPGSELNQQTSTDQVLESDHGLGQQKHVYYRPNLYPEMLLEKGIEPEPEPNYQDAPRYMYCQPNGYPEKIPKEGILPENVLNYQTAPGQEHGSVYNMRKNEGQNGDLGYPAPPGLNPAAEAAVAALPQLVQFAKSMEGAATRRGQGFGPMNYRYKWAVLEEAAYPLEELLLRGVTRILKRETPNPNKAPIPSYPCLLCKVNCNSSCVLEDHNNGKKHQKNMEKARQTHIQPLALTTESKSVNEKNPEENAGIASFERGTEREMSGGQNEKMKRNANGGPKLRIPKKCDLCNVKCDAEEMYEYHVAGKKHKSKVKRYESHKSMYGPVVLQALYPQISETLAPQQGSQLGPEPVITGVESSVPGLSS